MNPTSLASAARILWRLLNHHGIDPAQVYHAAGLDASKLSDPRARFADANTRAAWQAAERLINTPCFGLLAAQAV